MVIERIVAVILGWCSGALVNYLADVLPKDRRLSQSVCQQCNTRRSIFYYLIWPRECPQCAAKATFPRLARDGLVKILLMLSFSWLAIYPPTDLSLVLSGLTLIFFFLVIIIDLEHHLILHPVSLAGAGLGLWIGVQLHGWRASIIGGAVGFGIMLGLYFIGQWLASRLLRWRSSRSNSETAEDETDAEALGFGDVNLAGVIGLMLGWPGIIAGIALTIMLGGIGAMVALIAAILRRQYQATLAIAYGPFLSLAALLLLFFSKQILDFLY